jgi:preprotein translocase subunit YajC
MIAGVRCILQARAVAAGRAYLESVILGVIALLDFILVLSFLPELLAQASGAAPAKGGGGGGAGAGDLFGGSMFPIMIIVTALMFYLLMMRPEQRKRKEMQKQLESLKKNDHVVTTGGIVGTVLIANEGSKFVTLRIDDTSGAKIKVLRSAIMHVGAVDDAETEAKTADK